MVFGWKNAKLQLSIVTNVRSMRHMKVFFP
jgi:hypothetical protein